MPKNQRLRESHGVCNVDASRRSVSGRAMMRVLGGEAVWPPPAWMMRQAGRYLPEYRAVRGQAGSFLDLCYSPKLASEVTLQPIRRFGFDAAIIFSDILVVPHALGRDVRFVTGEGPRLDPMEAGDIARLDVERVAEHLKPVAEALSLTRDALPDACTLIGFCGAPWTVATYMIGGQGSSDQAAAKGWAYGRPSDLDALVDVLVEASIRSLVLQLQAGADCVQVFDTWAGSLDPDGFDRFVLEPTRRIVGGVRRAVPDARVIGFPRGAGMRLAEYERVTGVDAVGFDWAADPAQVRASCHGAIQGNLDPLRLVGDERGIDSALKRLFEAVRGRPFIFNLGHGITPEGPIAAVEHVLRRVRAGSV